MMMFAIGLIGDAIQHWKVVVRFADTGGGRLSQTQFATVACKSCGGGDASG